MSEPLPAPVFPNDRRDLPPAIARAATFIVPIALTVFDSREAAVAGREGYRCAIPLKGENDG